MKLQTSANIKIIRVLLLISIIFSLSSCVDGSWLKLVGRWQDIQNPDFELVFTQGGRYTEYFYGQSVGYGEFEANGSSITLHYLSPCGVNAQVDCDVRLRFRVSGDMLIITDSQGDIPYRKVSE